LPEQILSGLSGHDELIVWSWLSLQQDQDIPGAQKTGMISRKHNAGTKQKKIKALAPCLIAEHLIKRSFRN